MESAYPQSYRTTHGLEWVLLALFKWVMFLLAVAFGTGLLATLGLQAYLAITAAPAAKDPGAPDLTAISAAAFLDGPRAQDENDAGSEPVFTYMPEAVRKAAYQTLYDRVLATGREAEILGDADALVNTVNAAIKEFDTIDHPQEGTYAFVYLTKLDEIATAMAAQAQVRSRDKLPDLETGASWLRARLAHAVAVQARQGMPGPARPFLRPENPWLVLVFGVLFVLSAASWSLLAFIAQARVYWIVQEDPR